MTRTHRPAVSERLTALRALRSPGQLDACVISASVNIRYLTGFPGSTALLVVSDDRAWLLVDGRYEVSVRQDIAAGTISGVESVSVPDTYEAALAALLVREKLARVGFESAHVTVEQCDRWRRAAPDVEWVQTLRDVEELRRVKDAGEVALLRRAGRLLADVARQLPSIVAIGATERDIARQIDVRLEHAGFSGPAFPTIVASGPNSAHPHARPTARPLARGDLVLLDFGGVLDGYCVDLTRMAVVGRASREMQSLFDAVEAAQAAAISTARPGVLTSDVDGAARDLLTERGFGPAFVHATGHGLGLEVHEAPRIGRGPTNQEPLLAGMVFTVEPGAYVEGLGGVRLEDDVLITSAGCEVLTEAPRHLLVV